MHVYVSICIEHFEHHSGDIAHKANYSMGFHNRYAIMYPYTPARYMHIICVSIDLILYAVVYIAVLFCTLLIPPIQYTIG